MSNVSKIPRLATMTLETASGTLVPAAKNVIPITESGIFKVSPEIGEGRILDFLVFSSLASRLPIIVIIHATTYDSDPIQTMHITNVSGKILLFLAFLQSGMAMRNSKCIGQIIIHVNWAKQLLPQGYVSRE